MPKSDRKIGSADSPSPDDPQRPIRRAYAPVGRARDVDHAERVLHLRLLSWSIVGAFLGALVGVFLSAQGNGGPGVVVVTTLIGWVVSLGVPMLIMNAAGKASSTLYSPSGRSTPHKREYSLAESYAARGRYEEAVSAFAEAIEAHPDDPEPYLRAARIHRDHMEDCDEAALWFKRALDRAEMHAGLVMLTRKELVELYEVRMGHPQRALPLLARIAEESAGTPDGEWAASELVRLKEIVARESEPT